MPNPVPIYPAEGTVYDNVRDFMDHHKRQTENIQRSILGLAPNQPLPAKPENMPFPRMVYKPEYFSTTDRIAQKTHYLQVDTQQELDESRGDGWLPSLADAKQEWDKQQQQKQQQEQAKPKK
jgi:hypothetical protein